MCSYVSSNPNDTGAFSMNKLHNSLSNLPDNLMNPEAIERKKKRQAEAKAQAEAEAKANEPVKEEPVKEEPAPAPVAPTDTGSGQDSTAEANARQRKKRGYAATRVANDRVVLTDAPPVSGGRQTLG